MENSLKSNGVIRWGIIGAGDVCEHKSGPGFYKAPASVLQAITKRNSEAAEDFARRHHAGSWYTDPQKLINDCKVDAVYIATPPHLHKEFASAAMKAGKPVLVEKPMALNARECDAMIECSIHTGSPLWVAYYRRAMDKFKQIKKALEEGRIGKPQSVIIEFSQNRSRYALHHSPVDSAAEDMSNWRVDPRIAGAGVIADMGSHMLDLLDWFTGPVSTVHSVVTNRAGDYEAEDLTAVSFLSGNSAAGSPVVGTALWDFAGREEVDRTVIRGSEGYIAYATFDAQPAIICHNGVISELSAAHPEHVHQPLIELINNELRGGEGSPSTGVSGARTNRVLDAILGEYYTRN